MATLAQSQPSPPASTGSTHPFTCNTCQVAFRSSDLQRTHMQSDWHRYNLKRRVASLPPLTSEIFAEKVLANKASAAETAARASFEKRCEACEKTYFSEGAYVNHLRSQKHRLLTTRLSARAGHETDSMADSIAFSLGEPIETASTAASTLTVHGNEAATEADPEAEEEYVEVVEGLKKTDLKEGPIDSVASSHIPTLSKIDKQSNGNSTDADMQEDELNEHKADLNQCLFCNFISPHLDDNLLHMGKQHGFFIPEREYVVDLDGLTHMRDRGHCMVAYSTEEEQMDIGEFFDFRSTYSDDETEDDEGENVNGGVSLGVKRAVKTTVKNTNGQDVEVNDDDDDEGWESDGSLSSVPTDEITSIPIEHQHKFEKLDLHRHHSHTDPRPHKHADGFHSHAHHTPTAVYHDDYELHLPSGRTAGHRSLRVYYRQNLRHYPSPEERAEQRTIEDTRHESDADDEDAAGESTEANGGRGRQLVGRGNGGLGMVGVSETKKREVRVAEKREQKRQQRAQNRYQAGNEKRANMQKHFRDPLLQ